MTCSHRPNIFAQLFLIAAAPITLPIVLVVMWPRRFMRKSSLGILFLLHLHAFHLSCLWANIPSHELQWDGLSYGRLFLSPHEVSASRGTPENFFFFEHTMLTRSLKFLWSLTPFVLIKSPVFERQQYSNTGIYICSYVFATNNIEKNSVGSRGRSLFVICLSIL